MNRQCHECDLCCRLLPVKGVDKPANQRCKFQRFHKGCTVYNGLEMPVECSLWNCLWLTGPGTEALSRPDRSGIVLDATIDFITVRDDDTGETQQIGAIQLWCDPKRPTAHRDPALRAYLARRAEEGFAAIVRYSATDAFVLWAPAFTSGRGWIEQRTAVRAEEHTAAQIAAALGPDYVAVNLVTGAIEEDAH